MAASIVAMRRGYSDVVSAQELTNPCSCVAGGVVDVLRRSETDSRIDDVEKRRPKFAFLVRLPIPARRHIERRQPSALIRARVDAGCMADMHRSPIFLRRVAADHCLAGLMRRRRVVEFLPEAHVLGLFGERPIGVCIGVNEEMRFGLVVVATCIANELPMGVGDVRELGAMIVRGIRLQRRIAATHSPAQHRTIEGVRGLQHHNLVVAFERNEGSGGVTRDEPVDHVARTRAAVDVIAERDEQVVVGDGNALDERHECVEAAVDVTDGDEGHVSVGRAS